MLVDTDVMIWFLRGDTKAARELDKLDRVQLSIVTYIELVQGMRDKTELRALRTTLHDWDIAVVLLDEDISARAAFYVEEHFHSGGLRLADALIAATAINRSLPLLTANIKHYKVFQGLDSRRFRA